MNMKATWFTEVTNALFRFNEKMGAGRFHPFIDSDQPFLIQMPT